MFKNVFLVIIAIVFFILVTTGKEKIAIKIMVFFLPFGILFPSPEIPIGINGVMIWSIWIGILVKRNFEKKKSNQIIYSWLSISNKLLWIYYFLFMGIILGLIQTKNIDDFTKISINSQLLNSSLNIVTVVFFIKVLIRFKKDFIFQSKMKNIFILTIFFQLIPFVFNAIGFGHFSELMIQSSTIITDETESTVGNRFSGIIGDYELFVDYCLIIIGFSFINFNCKVNKYFNMLIMIASIYIGFMSGTRSFLIVMPLFFILYFLIDIFISRKINSINSLKSNIALFLMLFGIIVILIMSNINFSIFTRFGDAFSIYKETNDFSLASNRNILEILPEFLSDTNLFGMGSLYFYHVGKTEMVSHNMLLHIYAKYGIVGLLSLLFLFANTIYILFLKLKRTLNPKISKSTVVFISLLISLFVQEMKISLFRYQTTMLIYAFVFMMIYYHLNATKKIKSNI